MDYFDAFTTIARRHANQIEDGAHTPPEDRPEEPHWEHDPLCSQGTRAGDQTMPCDCNGVWVHGVGCPCEACQRDAWVDAHEAKR